VGKSGRMKKYARKIHEKKTQDRQGTNWKAQFQNPASVEWFPWRSQLNKLPASPDGERDGNSEQPSLSLSFPSCAPVISCG